LAGKAIEFVENTQKRVITPFKIIQGHQGGINSKPVSDFLLLINITDILSRAVSELSQLIIQILDTLRF